jgi:endonuclease/exonuclease/phosphatase (EEP) superfamily protein YafD
MDVSVGTFNLNNLFSRFNFEAQVDAIVDDDPDSGLTATYTFNDPERFRLRTYQGRLVHGKNPADQDTIAGRIASMDLDVLCAQEVEDIDTLRFFAAQHLGGRYRYLVLVEGNDPRLIDLAVLSRLPLGAVASHQHAVHPEVPAEAVFSRDLLEVDILHPSNRSRLFTVFNNHLKSHFVPFDQDPVAGKEADDPRPPASGAWTHRFKEAGQPARYELFDQIWLSPSLAAGQTGAFIDRRTRHGGDGSDHDPAWVTLQF